MGDQAEFACRMCGDCCRKHGLYPVTSGDVVDISSRLGVDTEGFLSRFCTVAVNDGRRGLFLKGDGDGACPFLEGDRCSIHDFRPSVCAVFPDPDGHVTADRLKSCMRDTTVGGEGLSRCAAWDLPDGGMLATGIEATIPFRIREDTDRHYFARHVTISAEVVEYLAGLADMRCRDLPLYLATGQKYSLLRSLHTGGTSDVSPLLQAERDILYRYAATYAQSRLLDEIVLVPEGVRAAYVRGQPGIALAVGRLPEAAGDARYFIRRLGEAGIISAAIEGRGIAYVTAFVIYTPCLDDMLRDGVLRLELSDGSGIIGFPCKEGIL